MTAFLLQNAKAGARMLSDWPKYHVDAVFWQWRITSVLFLNISPKRLDFNRVTQEFWSNDMLPTLSIKRDGLRPHPRRQRATCVTLTPFTAAEIVLFVNIISEVALRARDNTECNTLYVGRRMVFSYFLTKMRLYLYIGAHV